MPHSSKFTVQEDLFAAAVPAPAGAVVRPPRGGMRPVGRRDSGRLGFTLVVTLTMLAAVTILVIGLYGIVARESQTSASYDAVDQADLAVQSGLDRVGAMLQGALADELGVVVAVPLTPAVDAKERPREMLLAANYDTASKQWTYQPLASGVARPAASDVLKMPASGFENQPAADPAVGPSIEANEREARRLPVPAPWRARVPKFWMQVRLPAVPDDEAAAEGGEAGTEGSPAGEETLVARYCFEVEDLQGRLSLASAGRHDAETDVAGRPADLQDEVVPAAIPVIPGLMIDPGGRWRRQPSSVWTLLRPDLEPLGTEFVPKSLNAMHRRLTAVPAKRLAVSPDMWRELLVAPDALTGWAGLDPARLSGPAVRQANGSLEDAQLRALEENTTGFLPPYDELALVPHGPGLARGGERKLNLNRVLAETGGATGETDHARMAAGVEEIANHIDRHLPDFRQRAGGFPLPRRAPIAQRDVHQRAYLKNLAAGMLDYADKDAVPSISVAAGGAGDESAEANIEYRGTDAHPLVNEYWQRHRFERFLGREVECSLTDYVEIWNPTNQEITGQVSCCFEYRGRLVVGLRSYPVMSSLDKAVSGAPEAIPGLQGLWFRPQTVTLRPNEIRVLAFEPVRFHLDGGAIGNVTGVQYYGQPANGNDDRESRYRLAFRPAGAAAYTVVDLPFAPLERYQMSSNLSVRQRFNVNQPGLSYRLRDNDWAYNVGDTRAAYFIDYHQEVIDYDDGSSPWGRNYRRFDSMLGEVRTYLWPDGGHNTLPCPTRVGSFDRNPDDITLRPPVNPSNSLAERQKFVQRLSNAGRYYSMTELGHVFDPIMWDPNGQGWRDEPVLYAEHADLNPALVKLNAGPAELDGHKRFCGGNSLRVGRVEHGLFRPDYRDTPEAGRPQHRGLAASSLLDLFHCGDANSLEAERINGPLVRIDGHVNVNTATRETLRALVAGRLVADPRLKKDSSDAEPADDRAVVLLAPSKRRTQAQADVIADAIIRNRPYITPAEVAEKAVLAPEDAAALQADPELPPLAANQPVFGYTRRDAGDDRRVQPEWSDAAAEELFARLWNNSTVRSRLFQVVVHGQAVKIGRSGETHVVASRSRLFHLFVRPVRRADGSLEKQAVEITYSRPL